MIIGKKVQLKNKKTNGKIIDETKNTITIETEKGNKKIEKKGNTFIIDNEEIIGEKIIGRNEERIRKQK